MEEYEIEQLIARCKKMIADGYRVEAVREYRRVMACSLGAARQALDLTN